MSLDNSANEYFHILTLETDESLKRREIEKHYTKIKEIDAVPDKFIIGT